MELRVETLPGCSLPNGCYIGVRVGEVLKQGRYDPLCCYRFPALERQKNAKIDLYQHLGTCSAVVDPDTKANNEVKISASEPGLSNVRLKVITRPEASLERGERKTEVKKQAKGYLVRHRVEERLSAAVKALLASQPDDATEFLVASLRASCPKAPVEASPQPAPVGTQAEATSKSAANPATPMKFAPDLATPAKPKAAAAPTSASEELEVAKKNARAALSSALCSTAAPKAEADAKVEEAPLDEAEQAAQENAATRIQAIQRGKQGRRASQQKKDNIVAPDLPTRLAAALNAAADSGLLAETVADLAKQEEAAVRIQAIQRGKQGRRKSEAAKAGVVTADDEAKPAPEADTPAKSAAVSADSAAEEVKPAPDADAAADMTTADLAAQEEAALRIQAIQRGNQGRRKSEAAKAGAASAYATAKEAKQPPEADTATGVAATEGDAKVEDAQAKPAPEADNAAEVPATESNTKVEEEDKGDEAAQESAAIRIQANHRGKQGRAEAQQKKEAAATAST